MNKLRWLCLMAVLASACQRTEPPVQRPAVKASPPVTASATPTPGAAPANQVLQKPAGDVRTIEGSLALDAHYAVTSGGGRIISDHASGILVVGQALLDAGGNILANNAGNIIAHGEADPGGHNGGGLTSKVKYGLAQAPEVPPLGEIMPAAGLAVRVTSLSSGKDLSLGVDAAGKPVYEVYSGINGVYKLYLPTSAADNVLVRAGAPGSTDTDLSLNLVTPPVALTDRLDEDASLATDMIRLATADSFLVMMTEDPNAFQGAVVYADGEAQAETIRKSRATFRKVADEAGIASLPREQARALARRMADRVISQVDLGHAPLYTKFPLVSYKGPEMPVFNAYLEVIRSCREVTTKAMRQLEAEGKDPLAVFNARSYVVEGNKRLETPITIRKPVDFVSLVIQAYMTDVYSDTLGSLQAVSDIREDVEFPTATLSLFIAASLGNMKADSELLYLAESKLLGELHAMIRQAGNP